MPIYEYECDVCGTTSEVLYMKSSDAPDATLMECPFKHYGLHKRVEISKSNFKLGGKGWAKDGYENPAKHLPGGEHSGEKFLKEYRKAVSDPEHPYKPGDGLKKMGRKGDDFSDL